MSFVLVRGGGDLASGVALRLHQSGFPVMISELPMPVAVRRRVCFASAVYSGKVRMEDCMACRVDDPIETPEQVDRIADEGAIPILIDPNGEAIKFFQPKVVVDGRMLLRRVARCPNPVPLLIGLGPGFIAGENCDAVVETNRGASLGHVIWEGGTDPNHSIPEHISGKQDARVLRAPVDGRVKIFANIGDHLVAGQTVAEVDGHPVSAASDGVLHGLIYPGLMVKKGMRIGELDPGDVPGVCSHVCEKAHIVAEGVLAAICSKFNSPDFKH